MSKSKFPKQLYVVRKVASSNDPDWFEATETLDPEEDGEATAIYELKAVKTARIRETLE